MPKKNIYIVGMHDKQGRKIVEVSQEGWYKCEDGSLRDNDGYEWFANTGELTNVPEQEVKVDEITGGTVVVRDFKIAVMQNSFLDPQKFIDHHKKMVEATMVETGWDYDDDSKENPALTFGEVKDGFVHIFVRMKKRQWKNRDNAYAGARQGQAGVVLSKALQKAGALDPHIYGVVETQRTGRDIIAKRK